MSLSALLTAVRDRLRDNEPTDGRGTLGFTRFECDAHNDPQPHPTAGRRFVAVYPGSWSGGPHTDQGIQEYFGVDVGLTERFSGVPQDRVSEELYLKTLTGLEALANRIRRAIHRNYALVAATNLLLPEGAEGFIQPLEFTDVTARPEVKLGDWFWATDPKAMTQQCGLFINIRFGRAHRPQHVETMV